MKIAISACQTGMVESLSSMFSEHEFHQIGIIKPRPDWQFHMNVESGPFGRNVYGHWQDEEPIEKMNINKYDILIDVCESNDYNPKWRKVAQKWNIPRIIYITNPAPKTRTYRWVEKYSTAKHCILPLGKKLVHLTHSVFHYYRKIGKYPIVYTNEQLQKDWGLSGQVIYFSHDEWGVGGWKGDEPIMLYGKNGYYTWAPPHGKLTKLFNELFEKLGDKFIIHDSSKDFLPEKEWINYVAHKRIWFEHDFGSTGRAITQGVIKAMCLGLPVVSWKTSISQVWRFILNYKNGLVTKSVDEVVKFVNMLFSNYDLAKKYSECMVKVYRENFSRSVIKPKWKAVIKRAFEIYEGNTYGEI